MTRHESASPTEAFRLGAMLFCKRWTPLIVALLLERAHRFSEILARLHGISDRMLSERLKELEQSGVVRREVMQGAPVGVCYSLTATGRGLEAVTIALQSWSERNHTAGNFMPVKAR